MKNNSTDTMQHILDLAIKAKYREKCPFKNIQGTEDAYRMESSGKTYDRYLPNSEWIDFLNDMKENYAYAFARYDEGDGGETREKQYPPKMACYGSSSRFIYLESRDLVGNNTDFFEKKLETYVGGCANLDGYLSCKDGHLFIEAKCREIYGSETKKISCKYLPLYESLEQKDLLRFSKKPHLEKGFIDPSHVDITFYSTSGRKIAHTDIKQLLCHFLGISAFLLENPNEKRKVSFLYLIFKPIDTENCLFESSAMLDKVLRIRNSIVPAEFKSLDISSIFNAVLDYQANNPTISVRLNERQIQEIKDEFTFELVNQSEYREKLHSLQL